MMLLLMVIVVVIILSKSKPHESFTNRPLQTESFPF